MRPAISKGSILVWEAGKGGAHKTAGHVAVVEAVSEGGIYISDANWGDGVRFIAKEYLETHGIYLVPAHAL